MTIDLFSMDARGMAAKIAAGEVSSVELLQAHFDRIDRLNGQINAVIWQDRDGAMAQARACDAETAAGTSRGPLHGVPVTVKESFDLAGSPSTWGNPDWRDNIASADSDAVARYRAAGAVIFGKTNVPLMLIEWQSFNDVYGTTSNPWDLTRTPGGSSGGSGAALASGMSALEVGSDIGSSIRNPAHYNGVFGLKPTWNVVSLQGHAPKGIYHDTDIAVAGPLARSAGDLELAFDILSGAHRFLDGAWTAKKARDGREALSAFRVALKLDDPCAPIDAGYKAALEAFAAKLEAAGATIVEGAPDVDSEAQYILYLRLLGAAMAGGADFDGQQAILDEIAEKGHPAVQKYIANRYQGAMMSHKEWIGLDNDRLHARAAFEAFFDSADIVLTPVAASAAYPKNEVGARYLRMIPLDNGEQPEMQQLFWSGYSGVVGLPSVVGPAGQVRGLPVGYQAIARYGGDFTALAFAKAVEREIGGFVPPPGL